MNVKNLWWCGLVLALILGPAGLYAAETGSISGVLLSDGAPLAGVAVSAAGDPLPGGRTAVTREDGTFAILRLPPGVYEVVVDLGEAGRASRQAVVAVDRDTQLELEVRPTVAEEIVVEAAQPLIDARSAETEVNYTQTEIQYVPIARDYKGLFELAPGVAQAAPNRTAPNAGGSRLDNTFLIDGVNITNPHYGDIVPNIEGFDISEVNLKRAGITAEFGRTGGMVVNAITRSGTNRLSGRARFEYRPADWSEDSKSAALQNTVDRQTPAASLGGPFVRDHLWFYGSAAFPETTTTERRNNLGAVPDLEVETDEYFFKLTAAPSPAIYLNGAVRSRETTSHNAGIGASSHAGVASDDSTDYLIATFTGTWNVSANMLLEARYNSDEEQNSTDPVTNLGYRPAFDAAHPERMGLFTTTADRIVGGATAAGQSVGGASLAINEQDFTREEARLIGQSFLDLLGRHHDLRYGLSWEEAEERLEREANGWGSVTWNATTRLFTASYVSRQPPHTGRSETMGAFLQDEWSIGDRLTLMLGVAANRDEYFGEGLGSTPGSKTKVKILTFDWSEQIQPRLGVTFVPDSETGDRLYLAAGRYYNTENKSLTRAASPTRIFTNRATINAAGVVVSDVPAANTQNKKIDPGLDPMYTDEFSGGYSRPLGRYWTGEVSAMYRDVGNIFEDVSADGLGNGPFRVAQLDDAYRRYRAATLSARRTAVDDRLLRLWIDASYTWSRFTGNWDVDYANSLFFNSSVLQDGPGVLLHDNRDGKLRGDRTHVAKLFATVQPLERLRTGAYLRYQSGSAWEARGLPDPLVSSSSYHRYLETAGSRRNENWLNLDLLVNYEIPIGPVNLSLDGRILNVFDEQVALEVDDRLVLGRPVPYVPNNPAFKTATQLSPARAYSLTAIVSF